MGKWKKICSLMFQWRSLTGPAWRDTLKLCEWPESVLHAPSCPRRLPVPRHDAREARLRVKRVNGDMANERFLHSQGREADAHWKAAIKEVIQKTYHVLNLFSFFLSFFV